MIRLGLTGGIGSGKSTIAKVFNAIGVPVFYADDQAKKFLFNFEVKNILRDKFGDDIFDLENNIVRRKLAEIVFSDSTELKKLNSIIHPLLLNEFDAWVIKMQTKGCKIVVMEAAILLEAGFVSKVDKVLTITANREERIHRVVMRDSVNRDQVIVRMNNQWSDEKRLVLSDYVIDNSDNVLILEAIINLYYELLKQSSSPKY